MPLSRQEQIERNERRLTQIGSELEEIVQIQTQSTDPDEQRSCLDQLNTLEGERRALENANVALKRELEEAERERIKTNARIWLEEERPQAEKERDAACGKIFGKIRALKKAYDALREVEARWREKWDERGRPQYLNQDRPFVTSARRDIYSFLGMGTKPRISQTSDQKEIVKILGPTAQIAGIVGAEKRRVARRESAEVEKLRAETSPQGEQVEGKQPTENAADGTDG